MKHLYLLLLCIFIGCGTPIKNPAYTTTKFLKAEYAKWYAKEAGGDIEDAYNVASELFEDNTKYYLLKSNYRPPEGYIAVAYIKTGNVWTGNNITIIYEKENNE